MSKRNKKQKPSSKSTGTPNKSRQQPPQQDKPTLEGETVEPRILLSATWITGTDGDETLSGTADDDCIEGLGGNDVLQGGAGDDILRGGEGNDGMRGGSGFDHVDYTTAGGSISVDLTDTTAQNTGAAGDDTFAGIEGFLGSDYDDTVGFKNAVDGDVFYVDGGDGNDTLDFAGWTQDEATIGFSSLSVSLGGGESFVVNFDNVETLSFSDGDVAPPVMVAGESAPTANAGADQTVDEGDLVTLTGLGSTDLDGDILTYSWVQTAGPSVSLSSATAAQPTFTAPDIGVNTSVTFELTVNDGSNSSTVDTVTVNIGTWTEGDSGDNNIRGTAGDDKIRGLGGDDDIGSGAGRDTVLGGAGDDRLVVTGDGGDTFDGGADSDTIDFSYASGAVNFDLTDTQEQDTGGAGANTFSNFEQIIGSGYDDIFMIGNPADGESYSIDGGTGTNTISLKHIDSSLVTFGNGTIHIDDGAGTSFDVAFSNVTTIQFADTEATILTGDLTPTGWSGDRIFIDGDQAFRVTSPTGDIDWNYDSVSDAISISASDTQTSDSITIEDLNGTDLTIGALSFDTNLGSLTTNVDIESITMTAGNRTISSITVAGGTGSLGTFATTSGSLSAPTAINGNVDTVSLSGNVYSAFTVNGDAGSMSMGNITGQLTVTGDVASLSFGNSDSSVTVGGAIASLAAQDVRAALTANSIGSLTIEELHSDITIASGLASAVFTQIDPGATVTVNNLVGSLDFQVNGSQFGGNYGSTVTYTFDGTTQEASTSAVGNQSPTAEAGADQTVSEGELVTLTASGSNDADGDTLTYSWVQTSGPSVVLTGANTANPTFTAPEGLSNTNATFELTVSDGKSSDVTDSVTIAINADNDAPTANAGTDQTLEGNSVVTLDAANSSDPEGQGLTYTWTQTGGPTVALSDASAAQPTFTLPNQPDPTTFTFQVEASDGTNVSTDTVVITATPEHLGAHWKFDGTGQIVIDSTGIGNDGWLGSTTGTNSSDPTRTTDPERGEVLQFDGNDYLTGFGAPPAGEFSVSSWINQDGSGSGWQTILSTGATPEIWLGVNASTGVIRMNIGGASDYVETDPGTLAPGSWQHVSGTWDGTDGHIYIDGVDASLTIGGTPHDPLSRNAHIGAFVPFGAMNEWRGMLDDVRYYNDAIDIGDVAALAGNVAPTADAGIDQIVNEGDVVTLDATSSSDPEAASLTYTWVQTAGPTVTLSDASAAQPTFTAPEGLSNTDLTFRLQASDGVRTSLSDDVTVTVNADNDAPSADAGNPQVAAEGSVVVLNGSASADPEAQGLTYTWTQTAGPTVTLDDATSAQPTFTAPEGLTDTAITFDLTVNDGVNASSADSVTITITADNDAPTASAGADQTVDEGDVVTLSGLSSVDPELVALNYTWTQTAGPAVVLSNASAAQPTFTAPEGLANTTVRFQLTVTDGVNVSLADDITVHINADNDAPSADAGVDTTVDEGDLVTLNGLSSNDPEAQGLNYTWTQVSGPAVTLSDAYAAQPTFTAPEGLSNSTIRFQLQVSDGVNTSSADTVDVMVNANNDLPTANAGSDQTVDEGDVVTLTGLGSNDPESQGLTYTWTQTSGPTVVLSDTTAAQPTFTAPEGLINTSVRFQLQVTDGVNTSSADTIDVTINADNDAPNANAGIDLVAQEGDVVTLDGQSSIDPEAQGLTYTWTQVSGPSVTLSDATAAQPTFTAPEGLSNTTIRFQLEVSDGVNTSSADTIDVMVNADNDLPTASAGSDQTVDEGNIVTLNGLGSNDPEAQGLTYSWVQTSGPAVVLSDATAAQPTFTAPQGISNTSVQFQLQVTDGVNTSSADTVTVNVSADNDAPTASAGTDQEVEEGQVVTLDGLGSTDPEGQGLTYTWVQVSGPSVVIEDPTAAQAKFVAPEGVSNSTLKFELTVSDGDATSVSSVVVDISADDDAPTANAGANQISAEGNTVVLDGSNSQDPEGQGLTYAWKQISGPPVDLINADSAQATFDAPEAISNSLVRFELSVSDGTTTSTDIVNVGLRADNDAPSVDAGPDISARSESTVNLSASGSDPEGGGLTYQWQQVGGPAVDLDSTDGSSLTFVAPDIGEGTELQFQVGVSDGESTAFDTVTVVVAPNAAPVVSMVSQGDVMAGSLGVVGARVTDLDGDDLTYTWQQIDGPVVGMLSNDEAALRFQAPSVGMDSTVTFQVEVSDGTTTTTQQISVVIAAADVEPAPLTTSSSASAIAGSTATDSGSQQNPESSQSPTSQPEEDTTTPAYDPFLAAEAAEAVTSSQSSTSSDTANTTSNSFTRVAEDNQTTTTNVLGAAMLEDDSSSVVDEDLGSSSIAAELEEDSGSGFSLSANLLDDDDVLVATATNSRLALPDLLVADAGDRVLLQPRLEAMGDGDATDVNVTWEQVSGTPVDVSSTSGDKLLVAMPEVFVEEDVVFKVEIMRGDERFTQEVTVQVQPVGMTNRSLSIDDQVEAEQGPSEVEEDEGSRGFGKIWGALLAFFSTQTGRKKS